MGKSQVQYYACRQKVLPQLVYMMGLNWQITPYKHDTVRFNWMCASDLKLHTVDSSYLELGYLEFWEIEASI